MVLVEFQVNLFQIQCFVVFVISVLVAFQVFFDTMAKSVASGSGGSAAAVGSAGKVQVTMATLIAKRAPAVPPQRGLVPPVVAPKSAGDAAEAAAAAAVGVVLAGDAAPPGPLAPHASMATLFAAMRGGGAGGGPPGGGRGFKGDAAKGKGKYVSAQLRAHRALLLQLDARMRKRETAAITMTAPETFQPALEAASALSDYLALARLKPTDHGLGASDVHVGVAFFTGITSLLLPTGHDIGIRQRMAAVCLLLNHVLQATPTQLSEWLLTFTVAHLPGNDRRRPMCLMSWDIEGAVVLPEPGAELESVVAAVDAVAAGAPVTSLNKLGESCFHIVDGVPSPPLGTVRRPTPIARLLMSICACLGATRCSGQGPRGAAARRVLELGKGGRGKGRGRPAAVGLGIMSTPAAGVWDDPLWEERDDWADDY